MVTLRYLTEMRFITIYILTTLLTGAVLWNAFNLKKQFYPSVVYITKSNPCMAVLYIQALLSTWFAVKLLVKIFFGQLRAAEIEHLVEQSWYVVLETCLAFTVFRDDFSPGFVVMFIVLLATKSLHWLLEDRVDFMERTPVISRLFHTRVISLGLLLLLWNLWCCTAALQQTLTKGASVQLIFGFEYAILTNSLIATMMKYVLHTYDLRNDAPWEMKAVFLLHLDFVTSFVRVILHLSFFIILVSTHMVPLFAIRPTYYSFRAFRRVVQDLVLSRRAVRNMNRLFPNVTADDLGPGVDPVCIICRDDVTSPPNPGQSVGKKLPCNHVFHSACLRSWFQRQQTCPTCRADILNPANRAGVTAAPNAVPAAGAPNGQQAPPPRHAPNAPGAPGNPPNVPPPGYDRFMAQLAAAGVAVPRAPPQPPTTTTSNTTTPGTTTAPTTSTAAMPSFPGSMPGSSFPAPPPFPLPNGLTPLSQEQLESHLRQGAEARIQCLVSLHSLLDATVMQLQQYSQLCQLPIPPPTVSPSQPSSSTEQPCTSSSKASAVPFSSAVPSSFESNCTIPPPSDDNSTTTSTTDPVKTTVHQRKVSASSSSKTETSPSV